MDDFFFFFVFSLLTPSSAWVLFCGAADPEHTDCFPKHGPQGTPTPHIVATTGAAGETGNGWGWERRTKQILTCPQTSSPTPTNRHQSHCSVDRGEQLKGFPPNWTMTICRGGMGGLGLGLGLWG